MHVYDKFITITISLLNCYIIMYFETSGMYHVYNQGNNRQIIFFNKENYFFFRRKIRIFILPFADILAYCLMPNHFHLMISIVWSIARVT